MWQTFGHTNQKLFLDNSLKNNKLAHAYLFCGPSQVGKRTLALEFANQILGSSEESKINPDLIFVDGQTAKIEQMRELLANLSLAPYQYEKKVVIIDNFENIGPEAATSILKTLEEPNASSILILIAQNRQSILPTIVSRCQVIYFSRLTATDLASHIKTNLPQQLINGKIGKVISAEADKKYAKELTAQQEQFAEILLTDRFERLAQIKALSEKESTELADIFQNWLDIEQFEFLANQPGKFSNIRLLIESLQGLKQNLNKKLILQKLFLNLA